MRHKCCGLAPTHAPPAPRSAHQRTAAPPSGSGRGRIRCVLSDDRFLAREIADFLRGFQVARRQEKLNFRPRARIESATGGHALPFSKSRFYPCASVAQFLSREGRNPTKKGIGHGCTRVGMEQRHDARRRSFFSLSARKTFSRDW